MTSFYFSYSGNVSLKVLLAGIAVPYCGAILIPNLVLYLVEVGSSNHPAVY